jgi:hypothetical protein
MRWMWALAGQVNGPSLTTCWQLLIMANCVDCCLLAHVCIIHGWKEERIMFSFPNFLLCCKIPFADALSFSGKTTASLAAKSTYLMAKINDWWWNVSFDNYARLQHPRLVNLYQSSRCARDRDESQSRLRSEVRRLPRPANLCGLTVKQIGCNIHVL